MTAPLPPPPFFSKRPIIQSAFESMAQDYAKLAVRQALERVVVGCGHYDFISAKYIRAMIEELDK